MADSSFRLFRVSKLHELEVETGRTDANIVTLFIESEDSDRIALQIPMTILPEIVAVLERAISKWPGGN